MTSSAAISNTTFTNLSSFEGPAVFAFDYPQASAAQSLKVQNCTFRGNTGANMGGAVVADNVNAEFKNSSFDRNAAKTLHGGALMLSCSMDNKKSKI